MDSAKDNSIESNQSAQESKILDKNFNEVFNKRVAKALDSKDYKYQNLRQQDEAKEAKNLDSNGLNQNENFIFDKLFSVFAIAIFVFLGFFAIFSRKNRAKTSDFPANDATQGSSSGDSSETIISKISG